MNAKTEVSGNKFDGAKLLVAVLVLAVGIVGFYYFSDAITVVRVVGLLVVAAVAVVIASQTEKGRGAIGFFKDARTEVRKVVWPTRQETIQTTLMVIAMVVVVAIILWFLDMFLFWAVRMLTGQGG